MDLLIANRLRDDDQFAKKLATKVSKYLELGFNAVGVHTGAWDYAHDMFMCYAPLSKKDMESLANGHPKSFILPMSATQITTMSTYIAQVLFGESSPHAVQPRSPEDADAAEGMNALLTWNAEQQPTYMKGFLWVQDTLLYNRGIFYNRWKHQTRTEPFEVEVEIPDEFNEDGSPKTYFQTRRRQVQDVGYVDFDLVSPYDWCCDPEIPLWRMQEGRFCGHKFKSTIIDLQRRSRLKTDDPSYVSPEGLQRLLQKRSKGSRDSVVASIPIGQNDPLGTADNLVSRTGYYRNGGKHDPLVQVTADRKDKGVVECHELWVRLVPCENGLHDGDVATVWQFLMAEGIVLSVNESSYDFDEFPYTVGEARPSGQYQFSPSWTFVLKGLQDHVDYLKNRHQEALQRTVGNVFIVDQESVDIEDFLDPDKEGAIIALKSSAQGRAIRDVVQQVPVKDLTERFPAEMQSFVNYAENVTGANNFMQGVTGGADSATEFAGTQQMAAGRLASVARLLSTQALVPQTRQVATMFQQFLEGPQLLRYKPDPLLSPETFREAEAIQVDSDTIQGSFDFIAKDGTLPSGDNKKLAAIARLIEVSAVFPQVYQPAPGNLDPKKLLLSAARLGGLTNLEQYQYSADSAESQLNGMAAAETGQLPASGATPFGAFGRPGPSPADPSIPSAGMPSIPSAAPPQPRPTGLQI